MNILKIIKIIIREITPNFILRFLRFLKRYINREKSIAEKELIKEDISTLIDDYQIKLKEESLIIGNGPSFKYFLENHLHFIENKSIFCINSFADSEYFEILKPQFYVFADPAFWNKNSSNLIKDRIDKTKSNLQNKVSWKIFLLFPLAAKEWNFFTDIPIINQNISIAYYNNLVDNSENQKMKFELYKSNQAMVHCQTVLVSALFLSLNLGFKTNYLVGADLSLHEEVFVNKNNVVCHKEKHFYDEGKTQVIPFWKNPENTITFKIYELFGAFSLMFKGFTELEDYSKYLGTKIYNISNKSYIDAFERIDLDEIFNSDKLKASPHI